MRIRSLGLLAATAVLVLAQAAPANAADTTPPTAPGPPVATDLTEFSVVLTWQASTDDTGVDHYEVWRIYTDIVQRVATPATNTALINTLNRGSVSRFYVVALDAAGNRSLSSPLITVITLPGDLEPPGPVVGLAASEITDTSVRLRWQGVWWGEFERFSVYQINDNGTRTLITTMLADTRTTVVTGLQPGTRYVFGVSATDPSGNENQPSRVTVTTTGAPVPYCTVAYRVTSQWTTGFVAEVRITNTSPAAIVGWTLGWSFANGQTITNLWSGTPTQTGSAVTVTNMPYNATIGAGGGSQSFGFLANSSGTNTNPTSFTLNNRVCQTG